jgi:exonuclease I
VGKRGLTPYDASVTNQNSQIFVRRVKAHEESAFIRTFRCVVRTVNMEEELIEHVRCRPLLYDPSSREYRNQNARKEAAI